MKTIVGITVVVQALGANALTVDMPHGGCRRTVFEKGTGTINYGAMPRSVEVSAGTFNFPELVRLLRANSRSQASSPIRPDSGSVSLPEFSELRSIEDAILVRELLERGWKARIPPASAHDHEDHRWVAGACSFTGLVQAQISAA